ncbi:hypothetical protein RCH13_000689 [Chryseobacterium sp. MP_3.2]|nr:hypothetical protein [Chryseobacterium sp. MP_3.2]
MTYKSLQKEKILALAIYFKRSFGFSFLFGAAI